MCKCQIQSESCLQDPAKGRAFHHVMQCVVGKKFIVSRRGPTQFVGRMNLGSLLLCLSRSTTSDSRKTHLSYLDRKANEFAEELRCLVAPWDWNYCEVCGTGLTTIWFPYCRNQRYNVAQFHYPVSPWMKCNTLHFPQLQMDSVKKIIDLILPKCDAKRFV